MSGSSRAQYLHDVADLLWPTPLTWRLTRAPGRPGADPAPGSAAYQEFVVVPSARAPRLLVPDDRRLAAAALANNQSGSGVRERLRGLLLSAGFRLGLGQRLCRDRLRVQHDPDGAGPDGAGPDGAGQTLKQRIDAVTGTDGAWALPITRSRANRKPVIQVVAASGRPVTFVKVGTNDLTRALVLRERRALADLAGSLPTLQVPRVLGAEAWRGLELLLLSPLPLRRRRSAAPPDRITEGALAIMRVGTTTRQPLSGSAWWQGLGARLAPMPDARAARLRAVWAEVDDALGDVEIELAAWHGDWAPWNLAWTGSELLVWDFERFETGVPAGLDFVHLDLQTRILDPELDARTVLAERLEACPEVLAPAGLGAPASHLVFTAYLIEIALRWLGDVQDDSAGGGTVLDALVEGAALAGRRACAVHADGTRSR